MKRPGSGYLAVYYTIINGSMDVAVSVLDAEGNVVKTITFGGSGHEEVYHSEMDDFGNVYICGTTDSKELRMDHFKDNVRSEDAFLAKVDKDGNLLWQRGYCDTTSPSKGSFIDIFESVSIVGNKIYCVGETNSWQNPVGKLTEWDAWMVVFDENGHTIRQRMLPSIYVRQYLLNNPGGSWADALKLKNNDLVIRNVRTARGALGRGMDTTAILCYYDTHQDSLVWTKSFLNASPQGDIFGIGELGNGKIVGFDSYYNSYSIFDPQTGNPISTHFTGNNSGKGITDESFGTIFYTYNYNRYDDFYIAGVNYGINNSRPWLLKLDRDGNLVFSKTYDISNGGFNWANPKEDGGLQVLGTINNFGTKDKRMMVLSIDRDGNIFKP